MTNYRKGKIYKIVNEMTGEIYVGGTSNSLRRRLTTHIHDSIKRPGRILYEHVKNNGGWDNFRMELIEDYPCDTKEELSQREEYYRKELKATLNTVRANVPIPYSDRPKREYMKLYNPLREIINCECGHTYRRDQKGRHMMTNKHIKNMKILNDFDTLYDIDFTKCLF